MADLNSILPLSVQSSSVALVLNSPDSPHTRHRHSSAQHTQEDSSKHQSPESNCQPFLHEHKLSAFSIYNANSSKEKSPIEEDLSLEIQIAGNAIQGQSKTWIQKSKREKLRTQTKNLNRFFRSKLNEMLRDIRDQNACDQDVMKSKQLLAKLNVSAKIKFSEIGEVIKDEWLRSRLLGCRGGLLKYVHKGKMGMSSKLIMLKYFNRMMQAVKCPSGFSAWK